MTTTYRAQDPPYLDPADLHGELGRVFDICHGCRLCFNLCPSFHSLFDFIDRRSGAVADLTVGEHAQVVDECYQCKLCYLKCPYVPPHDWQLDFPRLMMRARAVRQSHGRGRGDRRRSFRQWLSDQFLGRTDLLGRASTAAAPAVNALTGRPGSPARRAMQATVGIASQRMLPPYARERFSTWFRRHSAPDPGPRGHQGKVSVFPTCFIEYMDPAIGRDLVSVCEHNRVDCTLPGGARCCGAPWLHQGDVERFVRQAQRNVKALLPEVRAGRDVVVAQPTCAYVLKKDYPLYLDSPEASLVAGRTFDASEYLVALHRDEESDLDTDFTGTIPESVTYHASCHLRAQEVGLKARDLIHLTGTRVEVVAQCSGIDGSWGYRAENYALAREVAAPLKAAVEAAGSEVVCGDCHLANASILEETGTMPVHPVQLLARAYGLDPS